MRYFDEANVENQKNFISNFANFDDKKHEIYYKKQTIENENEQETFVDFVEIQSICKRYEEFFISRNLLHNHIRDIKCLKQFDRVLTNSNSSKFEIQHTVKIITFMTSTND